MKDTTDNAKKCHKVYNAEHSLRMSASRLWKNG